MANVNELLNKYSNGGVKLITIMKKKENTLN
ncbi:hypothetical protein CoNPh35_CDS0071 [Staphylococcus phage S-CoN_Ph35]|nr:hypothetical protein CoNPh35_CDS0071 [Staphylococcus phage S-CoN_Ph35]